MPVRAVVGRLSVGCVADMDLLRLGRIEGKQEGDSDYGRVTEKWVDTLIEDSDLDEEHDKAALRTFLLHNSEAFSTQGELGSCDLVKHAIPLNPGTHPICQLPRRLAMHDREEVDLVIHEMCEQGIVRESHSPLSSPVVPVRKKDGTLRLCIDCRRLNDVTHGDSHPLPRVDDCLDALSGSLWFHTLDLRSGYWQQELEEDDTDKTAFSTYSGHYEFNRMLFGLKGAPASFQRLMLAVLAGLTWRECLVYRCQSEIGTPEFRFCPMSKSEFGWTWAAGFEQFRKTILMDNFS